ncbi:hypothetical protein ACLMJK_006182 [Lecanora helva]
MSCFTTRGLTVFKLLDRNKLRFRAEYSRLAPSNRYASTHQSPPTAIPERLLIYHAGTGKVVPLAPTFRYDGTQPFWVTPAGNCDP